MRWLIPAIFAAIMLFSFFNIGESNGIATHPVFAELATATYCPECPSASASLFSIYTSGDYPFYYVSMIGDVNDDAYKRIKEDYNFYLYPTVFFDGGKEVIVHGNEEAYRDAIEKCGERDVANVDISIDANWFQTCCEAGISIEITVVNEGNEKYEGFLRAYVTEINSRWKDYDGVPYHFGFLGYALLSNISIEANQFYYNFSTWLPYKVGYDDIKRDDMDNILIVAVLFNKTEEQGFADPPDGNPFIAHYVDAVAADIVGEGNLPPSVSITSPKEGYLYIFNKQIMPLKNTIIIGRKDVEVYAYDNDGIEKIEFYVDDVLKGEVTEEPYQWIWRGYVGEHTLKVIAYDKKGDWDSDFLKATIFSL